MQHDGALGMFSWEKNKFELHEILMMTHDLITELK